MAEIFYLNNLDYEYQLFDSSYRPGCYDHIIKKFEYVFFFIEKNTSTLYALYPYSEEYKKYLSSLSIMPNLNIHPITSSKKIPPTTLPWWGTFLHKEKEQYLNSKLTSFALEEKLKLPHPQKIYLDKDHLKNNFSFIQNIIHQNQTKKWILKNPFLMSGRGHGRIPSHESFINKMIDPSAWPFLPAILEQKVTIFFELGIFHHPPQYSSTADVPYDQYLYFNEIDPYGHYKGCHYTPYQSDFSNHYHEIIQNKLPKKDMDHIIFTMRLYYKKIIEELYHYHGITSLDLFNIDSLVYRESDNDPIHFYPLMEINFRKTMSMMSWKNHVSHFKFTSWKIYKKTKINPQFRYSDCLEDYFQNKPHALITSPLETDHISILYRFNHFKELSLLEHCILKKIFISHLPQE